MGAARVSLQTEFGRPSGSIRRSIFVPEGESSIRLHAAVQVNIGIDHFVTCGSIPNDKQQDILLGSVDESVRVAGPSRKARAHSGSERFNASVGFQLNVALQNPYELVLS